MSVTSPDYQCLVKLSIIDYLRISYSKSRALKKCVCQSICPQVQFYEQMGRGDCRVASLNHPFYAHIRVANFHYISTHFFS